MRKWLHNGIGNLSADSLTIQLLTGPT